jgi:hypothetical protein
VHVHRRGRRRWHSSEAGRRDPGAATQAAAAGAETAASALSGPVVSRFFLNLTFATRNPLNGLAQENPSEVLIFGTKRELDGAGRKSRA